jgi:hypothetical protein
MAYKKSKRIKKMTKYSLNIDMAQKSMKAIFYLLTLLLIISLTIATTWNQYTPSPTTSSLVEVLSLSSGRGVAMTNNAINIYLYNGSNWNEVTSPINSGVYDLTGYTLRGAEKVSNAIIYFAYAKLNEYVIIEYNPSTDAYTLNQHNTYVGISTPSFVCEELQNTCYLGSTNWSRVIPSYVNKASFTGKTFVESNNGLMRDDIINSMIGGMYEWNGVSWINRGTNTNYGGGANRKHIYYSSGLRVTGISAGYLQGIYLYNYSSGLFVASTVETELHNSGHSSSGNNIPAIEVIDGEIFYVNLTSDTKIKKLNGWDYNSTSSISMTGAGAINSIDYDENTGKAWAVADGGYIYEYQGTPSGVGSISIGITANPLTLGNSTNLYFTITNPPTKTANATIRFTGSCALGQQIYQSGNGLSDGTYLFVVNTSVSHPYGWQAGSCTISATAYFTDSSSAVSNSITWTINNQTTIPSYKTWAYTSSNPTIYGNQVIFYSKASVSNGNPSNLTLNIYDENYSTLIYTTTQNYVTNNVQTEMFRLNQNSVIWQQFPLATYVIETYGCVMNASSQLQCGVGDETSPPYYGLVVWNVTEGQMTNETGYEMTCYNKEPVNDTGFTYIDSLTAWSSDIVYSNIEDNTGKPYIASWDTSQPSNIKYSRQLISPQDQSGANGNPSYITGLDVVAGGNQLFVGTDDDLFIYTNASSKKASGLQYNFDKGFGALSNDGVQEVSVKSTDYAYVCQDGSFIDNDDIYLYNNTLADFQDKMNNNPCQDLKYDGGWVYAHRGGNNDVKIWDGTTQTNVATIDFTSTISTRAGRDLLDFHNDYLFFLAGRSELRRYDVSNHTNPTSAGKCFVPDTIMNGTFINDMVALETINDDEVLVGIYDTINQAYYIGVCDFANNLTYSAIKGGYLTQYVVGSVLGLRMWDIIKNNNAGKFSVAMQDRYNVCTYQKTIEPIPVNNPPSVDDWAFTPSQTICKNQAVDIEITGSDMDEGDYLSYGVSCSGGGTPAGWSANNLLTCYYSSIGTKTVTIQVKDNHGAYSTPAYDTVEVNDCNQTNITTIFFKIIDGETAEVVEGANIQLFNGDQLLGEQTTNANGYADFNGLTGGVQYRATISKDNYAPKTEYFYTSNTRYTRALEPTTCTDCEIQRTLLVVNVQDNNNTALEGVLVATLDPTTGASRYGLTDYSGNVYLFDVIPSNSFIVGAKKEGYTSTSVYASIGTGETKNVNIIMGQSRGANGYFPATERQCADTIKGVWLCGNLSYSGGNSCNDNDECMSGRCGLAISPEARVCSRFNYTLCDAQGINRGNTCIIKNMTRGIFQTMGDMILGNFMYVLLLVLLIVAGLIIRRSLTH